MLVSFLICGLEGRPWESLAANVQDQIDSHFLPCEVLTNVDSGESSSGSKRNELMSRAKGQYVAFIDDDDNVSGNYVESICSAIEESSPDVVTFCMDVRIKKQTKKFSYGRSRLSVSTSREKWSLGLWNDNRKKGMMAANHLCCWKKSIAEKSAWCDRLGYGDDQLWYGPLHALGAAKTASVIPDSLYSYECDLSKSMNQTSQRVSESRKYFGPGLRCFGDLDSLLIEDGHQKTLLIQCRDNSGRIIEVDTSTNTPFHTVRLL